MKLEVSEDAAKWFASELELKPGDFVRFVVKLYGGIPTAHPSYYLGISIGRERDIAIKDEVEEITFYFTQEDSWFLKEYDLKVIENNGEVEYIFN